MIGEKKLIERGACAEAMRWIRSSRFKNLQQAWDACPRGDWMLWLLERVPGATQQQLVNIACDCAERVLQHAGSGHAASEAAIALARRWAAGEAVTQQELRDAAADAVWSAADAASDAAEDASRAAAKAAAYAAYAAADAAYAAEDASHSAAKAAASCAAYVAANAANAAEDASHSAAKAAASCAAYVAANAANAAYAARAAAREEELRAQAEIVRKWVPVAPRLR